MGGVPCKFSCTPVTDSGCCSASERAAIHQSKLRANIATEFPGTISSEDRKIAAFKASVSNAHEEDSTALQGIDVHSKNRFKSSLSAEDGGGNVGRHRVTNLVGEYVMRCEGGKDCEKSVRHARKETMRGVSKCAQARRV